MQPWPLVEGRGNATPAHRAPPCKARNYQAETSACRNGRSQLGRRRNSLKLARSAKIARDPRGESMALAKSFIWLRGTLVELVDVLVPKPALRLLAHPKLHEFIGLDRIDAVGNWIDNNFMLKRRQKRTAEQRIQRRHADYLKTHFCAASLRTARNRADGPRLCVLSGLAADTDRPARYARARALEQRARAEHPGVRSSTARSATATTCIARRFPAAG